MNIHMVHFLRSPFTMMVTMFLTLSLSAVVFIGDVILPKAEVRKNSIAVWMVRESVLAMEKVDAIQTANLSLHEAKIDQLQKRIDTLEDKVRELIRESHRQKGG